MANHQRCRIKWLRPMNKVILVLICSLLVLPSFARAQDSATSRAIASAGGKLIASDQFLKEVIPRSAERPVVVLFVDHGCAGYCERMVPDFERAMSSYGDKIEHIYIFTSPPTSLYSPSGRVFKCDQGHSRYLWRASHNCHFVWKTDSSNNRRTDQSRSVPQIH